MLRIVIVLVHNLGEAKVGDLYVAAYTAVAQEDVARLEVVMDDGRLDFVQVFEGRHDLRDDRSRLPLANDLVLLEVKIEVVPVAVLEHRAERIGVYLEDVKEPDDTRVVQLLVNVVLPQGVLDVIGLLVVLPVLVQLVNLAGHVPLLL